MVFQAKGPIESVRFVVCGPHRAGKTTFLRAVGDEFFPEHTSPDDYDRMRTDLEYSRILAQENRHYVFWSIMSAWRFDFMWEIFSEGCEGYIFIVDSTRSETFRELKTAISRFLQFNSAPFIVAANKQERRDAMPLDVIRHGLGLEASVPIVPCTAPIKLSARMAFDSLLRRIEEADKD